MIEDGKPAVVAIGNAQTPSAQNLLTSGLLQKLSADHDAGGYGHVFSTKELHVAFINVKVFADEHTNTQGEKLQFIHLNETDEVLNNSGWNKIYSVAETGLYLVTPDRLVRPLTGNTAEEVYKEVKMWATKIRPTATPDVRLLDAVVDESGKAEIRVQNFSTNAVNGIEVVVLKEGQQIAKADYSGSIASLEDAVISINIPGGPNAQLTIIAKADGDANDLNNRWSGALRTADAAVAAAFGR